MLTTNKQKQLAWSHLQSSHINMLYLVFLIYTETQVELTSCGFMSLMFMVHNLKSSQKQQTVLFIYRDYTKKLPNMLISKILKSWQTCFIAFEEGQDSSHSLYDLTDCWL